MTQGRLRRIVPPLLTWWLALAVLALAVTWVFRQASDAGLDWAGIDVRRVLPLVALFLAASIAGGFLYSGLNLAGHQFLVTRMYGQQRDPERLAALAAAEPAAASTDRTARAAMAAIALLCALALGIAAILLQRLDLAPGRRHHGTPGRLDGRTRELAGRLPRGARGGCRLRGARRAAPAGRHAGRGATMPISCAWPATRARWRACVAADLPMIDIGRNRAPPFAGEHPPTLTDVIDLVRGRMKLNIELKYNVPRPGARAGGDRPAAARGFPGRAPSSPRSTTRR